MKRSLSYFILVLVTIVALATPASAREKTVVGWIEKVRIYPGNLLIRGKLDTVAKTCSLNAPHLTEFRRYGETWVRFDVQNKRSRGGH